MHAYCWTQVHAFLWDMVPMVPTVGWLLVLPDVRRQDAAVAAATTVWRSNGTPIVLPLTIAMTAIYGARLCDSRWPRLHWFDEPE